MRKLLQYNSYETINFTFIPLFKSFDLLCGGYKSNYLGKSFICCLVAKMLEFSGYSKCKNPGFFTLIFLDIHPKCCLDTKDYNFQ